MLITVVSKLKDGHRTILYRQGKLFVCFFFLFVVHSQKVFVQEPIVEHESKNVGNMILYFIKFYSYV